VRQVRTETRLKHVIVTNVKEHFPWLLRLLFTAFREKKQGHRQDISGDADTHWFRDVIRRAPQSPTSVETCMDDTAVLMYTGGTTGTIKGAQLTHRNIQANAVQIRAWFPGLYEGQEMILAALPFFHSYGMTTCMNLGIRTRTPLLLIVNPRTVAHVLASIHKHGPSVYPGVPASYSAIIDHPDLHRYDLSSVKFCISGAAPLPGRVQQEFQQLTTKSRICCTSIPRSGNAPRLAPLQGRGKGSA
jgi:long-chain acyl-CoA synthetase